ncbi:DUF2325 domain-containing protein [Nitrosomonas sp. Nm166]|uniref:DUF2325 domain-containing protein n=1 Tax=Nitrosomonas sp. Nm166 TaxID=1881054 RepID=UPI0008EFA119|nr:DUF2325 domain-containing protein [Nitrosomonas sp. Nm166]SFD91094.1 hypothetical protein SAMN05428977_100279 [Nitrosomonas sp. Nm166]
MKILKKLALANMASSGTISYHYSSNLAYTDIFLSFCLRSLEKLANRINQYLLIRKKANSLEWKFSHSRQNILNVSSVPLKNSHANDWALLIKANSRKNYNNSDHISDSDNLHLVGRSVLCVGGRAKLYPEYHQLIECSGGKLVTFHGDPNDHLHRLPQLLEEADMIICPIDCVNHEAFFIVKYYCQYSGKPCVLLDRSETNTFRKGISRLAILTE